MAEPGDPPHTDDPLDDPGHEHDDDLIGFATPASLEGRLRVAEPEPEPEPEPEAEEQPEPEEELFEDEPLPPESTPVEAGSVFAPSREFSTRRRRRAETVAIPGGGLGLYAVYALILFAVPTVGVSAAIGLFAVTGRAGPEDDLSSSHFIYQQRTLWAAAVAAVAGVILLAAPFALGVPILFALAIWMVLRGAWGVWTLKSGRAIADPRGWWI
ncbi:hypothetical protein GCM10007859_12440 [Brevundimonas denitrificans]|uniref:Uncharacterized protein n=1 Tax=Brevundimonas denitrificans TaxID=1443434 RepID=A0ABQ6BMX0_9CAUL|nr:hypothetical protein [Brevundimonas denitrificans]GLS01233.1 hypothetical protein GCM10007859_12440 [Brevundimonas denitrificans]